MTFQGFSSLEKSLGRTDGRTDGHLGAAIIHDCAAKAEDVGCQERLFSDGTIGYLLKDTNDLFLDGTNDCFWLLVSLSDFPPCPIVPAELC